MLKCEQKGSHLTIAASKIWDGMTMEERHQTMLEIGVCGGACANVWIFLSDVQRREITRLLAGREKETKCKNEG